MERYILGIDQGTTGVTALLLNEAWQPAARGYRELTQFYPQDGWVEHDAEETWAAVCDAVNQAIVKADITPEQITCIGLDHEGESVMLWDKLTGKPLYHTIVWQDRRTAHQAEKLDERYGDLIRERTGLTPDSYFSALKLQWLLDNLPTARELYAEGRLLAGTMDSWIAWKMTGGKRHITDASTASRTMLMDLHKGCWDEDILSLLDIPSAILPTICDSASVFGETEPSVFCGIRAPLCGVMTDQQAALFGQGCFQPGSVKATYGTGCFLLMNTGDKPTTTAKGLLPTVGWKLNGQMTYALDGGIYIAGAATQWLRDGLRLFRSTDETEEMALRAGGNGGVYFVPAFSGLAAPYWDSYARGMMIGITGATTAEHVVRATLESTAYQISDLVLLMEKVSNAKIAVMRCDGGAARNQFLMQFQADILGIPLHVPTITETTALGAAFMGAIGAGIHQKPEEFTEFWQLAHCYEPHMSVDERESLLHHWHRAVERAQHWIE